MYERMPHNINISAPNVAYDGYNEPFNMQAQGITYAARMNPTTGDVEVGQFQLTRLANTQGNSLMTVAIDADSRGNVYLAQSGACCAANRNNLTVNGQAVGPYAGGDALLMIMDSTFGYRLAWTAFNAATGGASVTPIDVAVRGDRVAFVASSAGQMITVNPLPGTKAASNVLSGYLAVLPTVGQ